jgi:uncharacterized membrane protein
MNPKATRLTSLLRVAAAHKRLFISVALAVATMLAIPSTAITRMLIGWDVGVVIYLGGAAVMMSRCATAAQMKRNAAAQDEGAFAILVLTVAAAIASVGAIFAELASVERTDPHYSFYGALAVCTVSLSWAFIHTIFALHYAHEFYGAGARRNGLRFPDDNDPDYWDFIYFSFVIGMTFQVSDVAVRNKSIRRMVVVHGALSFFFSTAVVALTVNIAANIIQK